jgi:hypothetical protein
MGSVPSENSSTRQSLKDAIDKLTNEQMTVLRSAAYMGLTPEQTRECEERRSKISELMKQFFELHNL